MTGNVPARTKYISYTAWLLAVLTLASLPSSAQTQVATVFGTVTDPRGAVIPGSQVTISSQSTGLKRTEVTDTTGQYRFAGLPAGSYGLRTDKQGFQAEVRGGRVRPGEHPPHLVAIEAAVVIDPAAVMQLERPLLDLLPALFDLHLAKFDIGQQSVAAALLLFLDPALLCGALAGATRRLRVVV